MFLKFCVKLVERSRVIFDLSSTKRMMVGIGNTREKRLHIPCEYKGKISPIVKTPVPSFSEISFLSILIFGAGYILLSPSSSFSKTPGENNKMSKRKIGKAKSLIYFRHLCSIKIDEEYFMTPMDFLRSITNGNMIKDNKKIYICSQDLKKFHSKCPELNENNILHSLGENAIISYQDYLFLLSIFTKSFKDLRLIFDVLDLNKNDKIGIEEYTKLCEIVSLKSVKKEEDSNSEIISTFKILLFGPDGTKELTWSEFYNFYSNIQLEIFKTEFDYHRTYKNMSELEFGNYFLKFSAYSNEEVENKLKNISKCVDLSDRKGISFDEFILFQQLLNHIDDLSIAMTLVNFAGKKINETEFSRAIRACLNGQTISPNLLNIIFALFGDEYDSSLLCYDEFLSVAKRMQTRKSQSDFKSQSKWKKLGRCVHEHIH